MRGSQSTGSSHTQALAAAVLCLSLILLSIAEAQGPYGGLSAPSPVGSPTTPPSSYEGGLVTNPNPMDSSGNAVIEGNVRGGKYFHAPIPYQSPTSFHGTLGSTSLDSFMRYSAIPEELGGYTPGYDTFYSPTGTVSKIWPGQGGVVAPTSPRVAGGIGQWRAEQPADVVDLGDIRPLRGSVSQTAPASDATLDAWRRAGSWSLGSTPEQMKQPVPDEMERQFADSRRSQQNDQPLTSEEYQRQMEQFRQQLEKVKTDASRLEQSLRVDGALPKDASKLAASDPAAAATSRTTVDSLMRLQPQPQPPAVERGSDSDLLPKLMPSVPDTLSFEKQAQAPEAAGIMGIMTPPPLSPAVGAKDNGSAQPRPPDSGPQSGPGGLAVDAATRTNQIAELFLPKGQTAAGQTQRAGSGDLPALQRIKEAAAALETPSSPLTYAPTNPAAASTSDQVPSLMDRLGSTSGQMEALADMDGNEPGDSRPKPSGQSTGGQISGKPDAITSVSQERADRHIKAAELYLQRGQYQRAAELFSLASLYNPNDRRAPLGRSHALFAAGQFVNSAIFLAKAIELDPGQTVAKLDLVNATGGPDLFLRRITELEQYARTSGTPDIQLLLAYIYYEMDRPEEARTAIEAAGNGLPHLRAVDLLKAAITK